MKTVKELKIPEGIEANVEKNTVTIKGKKGELKRNFPSFDVSIKKHDSKIMVESELNNKKTKSFIGMVISHMKNMITGVSSGWEYRLKILYLHFPVTVKIDRGKVMIQNFVGERTPRVAKIIGDTKVELNGDEIIVTGSDVDAVSQTSANLEVATKIKKYDRRIFQDGIYLTKKGPAE